MQPEQKPLRAVLLLLSLASCLVIAQGLPWRSTPSIEDPRLDGLSIPGYRMVLDPVQDGRTNRDFAYSSVHRFHLLPLDEPAAELDLTLVAVHSRESSTFNLADINHDLRLVSEAGQDIVGMPGEAVDDGMIAIRESGGGLLLQTCITPSGDARIDMASLTDSVNQARSRGIWRSIRQVLGVDDNVRWECLLVTLSGRSASVDEARLRKLWGLLYPGLRRWKPQA